MFLVLLFLFILIRYVLIFNRMWFCFSTYLHTHRTYTKPNYLRKKSIFYTFEYFYLFVDTQVICWFVVLNSKCTYNPHCINRILNIDLAELKVEISGCSTYWHRSRQNIRLTYYAYSVTTCNSTCEKPLNLKSAAQTFSVIWPFHFSEKVGRIHAFSLSFSIVT